MIGKTSDGLKRPVLVDPTGQLLVSGAGGGQVFNYTQTGTVASSTVLIGPIDCSQFVEVSVQVVSLGTGATAPIFQVSNNGTNFVSANALNNAGTIAINLGNAQLHNIPLLNAKFFQIVSQGTQTAGTTTLVAYASQTATPKLATVVQGVVIATPNTGGAPSLASSYISLAGTNALVISSGTSNFYALFITNTTASMKYVKAYNRSTLPTIGTDVPTWTIGVPPMATIDINTSFGGTRFLSGISIGITGGYAVTDTTAVAAGDVIVNWVR